VGIGSGVSVFLLTRILVSSDWMGFHQLRRTFARYLVLALEFQLAADIIATAIDPDWGQLGRLGAIAAIRTFLNYFLQMEMREETSEGNRGAS